MTPADLPAHEAPHWTGAARALLEAAVRRHGGWEAWRSVGTLEVRPKVLSGLVPWMKGHGRTFRLPARAEIDPHEARATFFDYPSPGGRGTFLAGRVDLVDERGASNSAAEARLRFRGLGKLRRWTPADALYFFGYALTHYHSLPFTLGQGKPLALRRARFAGRWLAGVEVELPPALVTHSRRQTFYFEEDGLLRRHDYVADIIGSWARGAHLWRGFATVAGLEVATERHVVVRLGRRATAMVALHAELAIAAVRAQPASPG